MLRVDRWQSLPYCVRSAELFALDMPMYIGPTYIRLGAAMRNCFLHLRAAEADDYMQLCRVQLPKLA